MRNDLSMNRIDNSGKGIAGLGRGEDTMLAHVAPGEMVVPPVISPQTQEIIKKEMMAVGLDPNEYTVGDGMSINPITGMAEFGWLKKTFKSIGKVVKKVAPVAVSFIPGIGPVAKGALTAVAGKASGMDTKSALLGGLTAGIGAKFAGSGSASKYFNPAKGTKGILGGTLGPNIRRGIGGLFGGSTPTGGAATSTNKGFFGRIGDYFNPAEGTKGILGGNLGPGIRRGIGGLFSGGFGGQPEVMYQDQFGNIVSADEYAQMIADEQALYAPIQMQTQGGGFIDFIRGGGTPGQSRIGLIEDFLKGRPSDPVRGGFFGGQQGQGGIGGMLGGMGGGFGGIDPSIALLAGLYGKAVKESYKDREGGMRDIRQSIRPDLMPAPTFTGFDLGIRKNAAMGGLQELDMRGGGPSIGPGTGTSDDIPAMLSDGEFVMTSAANNGLGGFKVTKTETGIELIPNGKPDRQKGAKNMDKLMKSFEQFNKIGQV